jgi:hypothetical protein
MTNVIGFLIAVSFGILAVAAAFVIRGYLLLPLQLYWQRATPASRRASTWRQLRASLAATAVMAAACWRPAVCGPERSAAGLLWLEVAGRCGSLPGGNCRSSTDRLSARHARVATQALPGGVRAPAAAGARKQPGEPDDRPSAETTVSAMISCRPLDEEP